MFYRSVALVAVSSVMMFLALLATALRVWSEAIRGRIHKMGWEEVWLFVGLILSVAICICNIIGAVDYRFGDHELYVESGPNAGFPLAWLLRGYGKIFYALQIFHCCAVTAIKISFLDFLRKTFGVYRYFRMAMWVIGTYVFLWWLMVFWMTIFQCWPISSNWGTTEAEMGNCIPDYKKWYAWCALLNVLSDVAVAAAPIPAIWKLVMPRQRKILTTGLFLTAAVVIVASIGRTVSYFDAPSGSDFTYSNYYYLLWTAIEPCLGVVGICMPRMRPLFSDGYPRMLLQSLRSMASPQRLLRSRRSRPEADTSSARPGGQHAFDKSDTHVSARSDPSGNSVPLVPLEGDHAEPSHGHGRAVSPRHSR